MTNKPKRIGTSFESLCRNFLQAAGWHEADRLALTGSQDRGDLVICTTPWRVHAECKAGATAAAASDALIESWMDQAERERRNADATLCPLIVYRYRRAAANHDVYLPLKDLVWLEMGQWGGSNIPVRMSLADFSELLQFAVDEHEAGER